MAGILLVSFAAVVWACQATLQRRLVFFGGGKISGSFFGGGAI